MHLYQCMKNHWLKTACLIRRYKMVINKIWTTCCTQCTGTRGGESGSVDGEIWEHLDTVMIQYLVLHPAFRSVGVHLEWPDLQAGGITRKRIGDFSVFSVHIRPMHAFRRDGCVWGGGGICEKWRCVWGRGWLVSAHYSRAILLIKAGARLPGVPLCFVC